MAGWQVSGRLRTGVAIFAVAVAVSLVAPTSAGAIGVNSGSSSSDSSARARDVQAKHKVDRSDPGSSGANSASQQSSGPSSSPGPAQRPQRKDKPPDRDSHKFSPQKRSGQSGPGASSGSSPRSTVGGARLDDRDPNKFSPERRTQPTTPDRDDKGRPAVSKASPSGLPGRSGASGSAPQQQLVPWAPRKAKNAKKKPGAHDLAYRYPIGPERTSVTPYDWDLDDLIGDIGEELVDYGSAYWQELIDAAMGYVDLGKLIWDTRYRPIYDPYGAMISSEEAYQAIRADWERKIETIVAVSEDPVGETKKFLDTELERFRADPGGYLGQRMGQNTVLAAEAVTSRGLGSALRHGLGGVGDTPTAPRPDTPETHAPAPTPSDRVDSDAPTQHNPNGVDAPAPIRPSSDNDRSTGSDQERNDPTTNVESRPGSPRGPPAATDKSGDKAPDAQVKRNKKSGDDAADAIARRYPGSRREVTLEADSGSRRLDVLTPEGLAIESKVGRTYLTKAARQQVQRDLELLKDLGIPVDAVQWFFSRSLTTGKVGPSAPLLQMLEQAGFDVVIGE